LVSYLLYKVLVYTINPRTGNICWPGNNTVFILPKGVLEYAPDGKLLHCFEMESYIWERVPYYHKAYVGPDSVDDLVFDRSPYGKMKQAYEHAVRTRTYFHFVKYFAFRLSLETVEREVGRALRRLLEEREGVAGIHNKDI
jgi:hypothetical protein